TPPIPTGSNRHPASVRSVLYAGREAGYDRRRESMRLRLLFATMAICALAGLSPPARADKIDDLTRALMQDPSYKVRVQAALVLGKLNDRRAVPALMQALKDENESVRGVAATS